MSSELKSFVSSTIQRVEVRSDPEKKSEQRAEKRPHEITARTGGAYMPPSKLRMLQAKISDKGSTEYQRIAWESLKKSINGLINKVNAPNIGIIVRELFKENLIRAKGLFARSILQAQAASPTFTHVYAAVVAVVNSKFPQIGELILIRLIISLKKAYQRNDKQTCLNSVRFIAHLVNQEVAHEILALEILTLLLENTTNDSLEVAIGFLKEVGMKLSDLSPRGINAIFDRLRTILHDGTLDPRVMYMIEVIFAVRKDGFKDHPSVVKELDLVEEEDQHCHMLSLEDELDPQDRLNVFQFDPKFEENEAKYQQIKKDILDESGSEEDASDDEEAGDDEEDSDEEAAPGVGMIIDNTETNLTELRKTIYLTIQSSLDFEECAHKVMKLGLKGKQIEELCHMVIDCCAQQRTYIKFYGLLAQRFCALSDEYVDPFSEIFKSCYDTIHRFETNKLRNVAKLFAHLFYTDSLDWNLLGHIKLNERDTTSSSRVFIKILFQELVEYLGLVKLNERLKDDSLQEAFGGLFPKDDPKDTRFSINFFTSIGLGGLTEDLREHLENTKRHEVEKKKQSVRADKVKSTK